LRDRLAYHTVIDCATKAVLQAVFD
jgi:hypothetical protein